MKICVIGSGYVGLVSAACLADAGHQVVGIDRDEKKIKLLEDGQIPIYEPGLEEIVKRNTQSKTLFFSTRLSEHITHSEVAFIAVGTPPGEDGSADLSAVLAVAKEIGKHMIAPLTIVNKSTVPVGTAQKVKAAVQNELNNRKLDLKFSVVSNPEFLKEGDAITDFMRPDRIVVGVDNEAAGKVMQDVYASFVRNGHPILLMDVASAELTKYAANCMLATRISFMNEISMLATKVGADIENIRKGIGSDSRIGMSFLYAGLGYGGSCFPKDVKALVKTMQSHDIEPKILNSVEEVNATQRHLYLNKIFSHYGNNVAGKRFAVWGLSFKPKTDDMREAPSVTIIEALLAKGAHVVAHDPVAHEVAEGIFGHRIQYADSIYSCSDKADAVLLLTEWNQFRNPDFAQLEQVVRSKTMFDGRNQFDVTKMKNLGWAYFCFGR